MSQVTVVRGSTRIFSAVYVPSLISTYVGGGQSSVHRLSPPAAQVRGEAARAALPC